MHPKEDTTSARRSERKKKVKSREAKERKKNKGPYVCACFALRDVVFALLPFRSREEKKTTIRSMQSLPPPRTLRWRRACDEERHARKEKSKERKKERRHWRKGCVERRKRERKSEVSRPLVAPSVTEEEKKEIFVLCLSSVVVSCLRPGVDLAHHASI